MKKRIKMVLFIGLVAISFALRSQTWLQDITPDDEKKFTTYMFARHGGPQGVAEFKETNRYNYFKEVWYYSKSFYVKRDSISEGITLNESFIDITRFEDQRKNNEEVVIFMPGYRDALILLPANKLIYKP